MVSGAGSLMRLRVLPSSIANVNRRSLSSRWCGSGSSGRRSSLSSLRRGLMRSSVSARRRSSTDGGRSVWNVSDGAGMPRSSGRRSRRSPPCTTFCAASRLRSRAYQARVRLSRCGLRGHVSVSARSMTRSAGRAGLSTSSSWEGLRRRGEGSSSHKRLSSA